MRKPAWDGVEHKFCAQEPVGYVDEKLPYPFGIEIHQQSLSDDENARRGVDRVHPDRIERTCSDVAQTIGWLEKAFPQSDRVGQIHGQPAHPAVVDTLTLRFQA